MVSAIEARVAEIDSTPRFLNENFLVYVKLINDSVLVQVTDTTKWPESDSVEASYNVTFDSTGALIVFSEIPFSVTGDWYVCCSFYFAADGHVMKYERYESAFNSLCLDGRLCDRLEQFYTQDGTIVSERRNFTDIDGRPVDTVGCETGAGPGCEVFITSSELRRNRKL